MKNAPMTQQEFVSLLEEVLKEKKENRKPMIDNSPKYIAPYDNLYDKCLLGYEVSHAKKTYTEESFNFKIIKNGTETIEAKEHLQTAIVKLVKLYGKEEVALVLRDL